MTMIDEEFNIVWSNEVAQRRVGGNIVGQKCYEVYHERDSICESCSVAATFADGKIHDHETKVELADGTHRTFWTTSSVAARHEDGHPRMVVEISRDITERKQGEAELRAYQERLKYALHKLTLSYEELSTPVVQVWDRVLAMPLVGIVDSGRAQRIMDTLLTKIVETRAEVLILDVTGVANLDTEVTDNILRAAQSTELLGTECIITGIKPEVAQTIVHLGSDMTGLITKRDLQEGLRYAFDRIGYRFSSPSIGNQVR
jgi:rsbT co-antagonist protein RsbR